MLETLLLVGFGPARWIKIRYFLEPRRAWNSIFCGFWNPDEPFFVRVRDPKPTIYWVWGSIVVLRVLLFGLSFLQKCVPQYRRSTYSGAKTTRVHKRKLLPRVSGFRRCQKTLFPRQPGISRNRDMLNFVQSRGRRDRGRLLLSCLTKKGATERASWSQNSINCGFRARPTEKTIWINWALNS